MPATTLLAETSFQVGNSVGTVAPIMLVVGELTVAFGGYILLLLFVMGQKEMFVDLLGEVFRRKSALPAER